MPFLATTVVIFILSLASTYVSAAGVDNSPIAVTALQAKADQAYGPALPFSYGTAAVGTERAPGFEQIDSSLFKHFHIKERHTVSVRVDAFNVFNFASYGNPDNNVTDTNFGQITNTRSGPRTIELVARYSF
jgi:hypothetical protein